MSSEIISVGMTIDTSDAEEKLKGLSDLIAQAGKVTASIDQLSIHVMADKIATAVAEKVAAALSKTLQDITVKATVDTSGISQQIQQVEQKITSIIVPVKADTSNIEKEIQSVTGKVKRSFTLPVPEQEKIKFRETPLLGKIESKQLELIEPKQLALQKFVPPNLDIVTPKAQEPKQLILPNTPEDFQYRKQYEDFNAYTELHLGDVEKIVASQNKRIDLRRNDDDDVEHYRGRGAPYTEAQMLLNKEERERQKRIQESRNESYERTTSAPTPKGSLGTKLSLSKLRQQKQIEAELEKLALEQFPINIPTQPKISGKALERLTYEPSTTISPKDLSLQEQFNKLLADKKEYEVSGADRRVREYKQLQKITEELGKQLGIEEAIYKTQEKKISSPKLPKPKMEIRPEDINDELSKLEFAIPQEFADKLNEEIKKSNIHINQANGSLEDLEQPQVTTQGIKIPKTGIDITKKNRDLSEEQLDILDELVLKNIEPILIGKQQNIKGTGESRRLTKAKNRTPEEIADIEEMDKWFEKQGAIWDKLSEDTKNQRREKVQPEMESRKKAKIVKIATENYIPDFVQSKQEIIDRDLEEHRAKYPDFNNTIQDLIQQVKPDLITDKPDFQDVVVQQANITAQQVQVDSPQPVQTETLAQHTQRVREDADELLNKTTPPINPEELKEQQIKLKAKLEGQDIQKEANKLILEEERVQQRILRIEENKVKVKQREAELKTQAQASIVDSPEFQQRVLANLERQHKTKLKLKELDTQAKQNARASMGMTDPVGGATPRRGTGGGGGLFNPNQASMAARSIGLMGRAFRGFNFSNMGFAAEGAIRLGSALTRALPAAGGLASILGGLAIPAAAIGGLIALNSQIDNILASLNKWIEAYGELETRHQAFLHTFSSVAGQADSYAANFSQTYRKYIGDVWGDMTKMAMSMQERGFGEEASLALIGPLQQRIQDVSKFFHQSEHEIQNAVQQAINRQYRPLRTQTGILMTRGGVESQAKALENIDPQWKLMSQAARETAVVLSEFNLQLQKTEGFFNKFTNMFPALANMETIFVKTKEVAAQFGEAIEPIVIIFQKWAVANLDAWSTWIERNTGNFEKLAYMLDSVLETAFYLSVGFGKLASWALDVVNWFGSFKISSSDIVQMIVSGTTMAGMAMTGFGATAAIPTGVAAGAIAGTWWENNVVKGFTKVTDSLKKFDEQLQNLNNIRASRNIPQSEWDKRDPLFASLIEYGQNVGALKLVMSNKTFTDPNAFQIALAKHGAITPANQQDPVTGKMRPLTQIKHVDQDIESRWEWTNPELMPKIDISSWNTTISGIQDIFKLVTDIKAPTPEATDMYESLKNILIVTDILEDTGKELRKGIAFGLDEYTEISHDIDKQLKDINIDLLKMGIKGAFDEQAQKNLAENLKGLIKNGIDLVKKDRDLTKQLSDVMIEKLQLADSDITRGDKISESISRIKELQNSAIVSGDTFYTEMASKWIDFLKEVEESTQETLGIQTSVAPLSDVSALQLASRVWTGDPVSTEHIKLARQNNNITSNILTQLKDQNTQEQTRVLPALDTIQDRIRHGIKVIFRDIPTIVQGG